MSATASRPPARTAAASVEESSWPITLSVRAYGVCVGIRVNDRDIAAELAKHLPPGSARGEFSDCGRVYSLALENDRAGKPRYAVYSDDLRLAHGVPLQAALRAFESHLQLHVAEMAPRHVFVHAGVVGYRGAAILLPGRSFAGKSTLVAELVRAGAEYYSDEYAVLDASGRVHPYARPILIRPRAGSTGPAKRPTFAEGRVGTVPLPVGLILLTNFRSGATWLPRRLSPGRGVLALLDNTVSARRAPEAALATLRRIVTDAPVVASERGEASEVAESILGLAVNPKR